MKPIDDHHPKLDKSKSSSISNDLQKQLEQSGDNISHHSLKQSNGPEQVVEKIRSVILFKAKVSKRIDESIVIPHFPGMKTKLLEMAVDKFKSCEISRSSSEAPEMQQSCLGLITAQMMSLINGFEKNPSMNV